MREVKQGAAVSVMLLMVDAADHVTGLAGLAPTISLSKNGGVFAAIAPAISDRGNGWYSMSLSAADTETIGDLVIHAAASGADPSDRLLNVVSSLEADTNAVAEALRADYTTARAAKLGYLDAAVSSRLASVGYVTPDNAGIAAIKTKTDKLPADPASNTQVSTRLEAAAYTAPDNTGIAALAGYVDTVETSLATLLARIPAAVATDAGLQTLLERLSAARALLLDNLDTAVSSRLAAAGYTAPDNVGIAAVNTKADRLQFDGDNRVQATAIVSVDNAEIAAAVWDEPLANHLASGSAGEKLGSGDGGTIVLPVVLGKPSVISLLDDVTLELCQGNTYRLTFALGNNYTGWIPRFGAKRSPRDMDYRMPIRNAVWTDASAGAGYVDLTSSDTAVSGRCVGELELVSGASVNTRKRYLITIRDAIIKTQ